ncbi:hypothetical protein SPRG_00690 [Saprolegnia parasitica CBS 223.65]|uniref:mannan endo-1,4-beta-mannosidase n=1 Tax=Saprolegnia parasitica (strain CBS 223.65) TaxID=695850 RepID=A0A067D6K2_SAPPC|nr:hypothetical protein SPRG_00690 [Saprolegnia parasitica CBS 223.65]KDO34627.1 hypothetical protein SPRG_00690 [Saprolegnia parasitica CBS 223.65]|eukprot:XP_012194303.1 hypothetical protein SPRG_00690 [Saprolegnia parasitica CBS 223.65]
MKPILVLLALLPLATMAKTVPDWQVCNSTTDTCASKGWVCCVAADTPHSKTKTCRSGASQCLSSVPKSFAGANSYFLHTLVDSDRREVLDKLKASGFKTVRIFLSRTGANTKGAKNVGVNDVENPVGQYDDSILSLVDKLIRDCYDRNMKLIIAFHDRWSLGCWDTDAYVTKYNLPTTTSCQQHANIANDFYTRGDAQADFDNRIQHILAHRNPYLNNRPWSELSEAILGFEPQNESQGGLESGITMPNPQWLCNRAKTIRNAVSNRKILVMSGGGTNYGVSQLSEYFRCPALDVVAIHSYEGANADKLKAAVQLANVHKKRVLFEEFGASGSNKASGLAAYTAAANAAGVPWMVWQVLKPSNHGDFETWTDEKDAWAALTNAARQSNARKGAWSWPELNK